MRDVRKSGLARPASLIGLVALVLAGCSTIGEDRPAPGPTPATGEVPTNLRTEMLIGSWGVASYRMEKDRPRVEAQARAQCKLPYTITRGPGGGVMMYVADDPKLYELRLKGGPDGKTYLGFEAPPGDLQDRVILQASEKLFVMRFVDPDADKRYGINVFVRCGA